MRFAISSTPSSTDSTWPRTVRPDRADRPSFSRYPLPILRIAHLPTYHRLFLWAVFGLAALVVAGCASTSRSTKTGLPSAFPGHSVQQIRQHIALSTDTLTAFAAKAQITVESPQESGRYSATIRQRRNDSLYVSVSPGFGIEAARMLVTPDSFFVYDRIHKQLAYGALADAQSQIPFLLTTQNIFENLLGFPIPEQRTTWQVEADDAHYYLHDPKTRRTFTIDPTIWRVVHYEQRTSSGELLEERVFSDYGKVEGVYVPGHIKVQRPQDDTFAALSYRELELNPGSLSFNLRVNDEVTRVPLLGRRE